MHRLDQVTCVSDRASVDKEKELPVPQHLYHEDDSATRILRKNSDSSTGHGARSKARYDLTQMSPAMLYAYTLNDVDDKLHEPGRKWKREGVERLIVEDGALRGYKLSMMGMLNLSGYPMYNWFIEATASTYGATNLGGVNGSGQVPDITGYRGLIDSDTPDSALTRTGFDGKSYQLVFSDEFNQDGRGFGLGEDPYWQAVDLHYWQTEDLEWYDPDNIGTEDGYLYIMLSKETNASSHGLGYLGGMLQSWNRKLQNFPRCQELSSSIPSSEFCFTGGYIEVAVSLPGDNKTSGYWPAVWTMGNLRSIRAELDTEVLLMAHGHTREAHPGPTLSDGTFPGRSAPEIDIFEGIVEDDPVQGKVSQSSQWAPFNPSYDYLNNSTQYVEFFNSPFDTEANSYLGGVYQQVISGLSLSDGTTYNSTTNFQTYGFEYTPSARNGYGTGEVTWAQGGEKMWRLSDLAMDANAAANVSERVVTSEPMYIIMNLGMSPTFGTVDLDAMSFPVYMRIDYVRVYQDSDNVNVGCSPPDYPTAEYIAAYPEQFNNPNATLLADTGMSFPKNRLIDTC
ncbi:glycoside hydrolase family 16 protein [Pseudohyphozyma bogoriensis]|nr:glycoside hydrolase family 16 protein [Pseudohyphozyma bogoriensis]